MVDIMSEINQFLYGNESPDARFMKTNVRDYEDHYLLTVELPGVDKEDIKISLKDGELTINVNKEIKDEEDATYLLKERYSGTLTRTYEVGNDVIFNDISAKLDKGVLTLNMKKRKEEQTEQFINIE